MGIKIEGLLQVEEMVMRVESDGKRRVVKKLIEKGTELQKLAQRMAPRDYGNLEEAIKMTPEDGAQARDAGGRFVKTEIEVYVDMEAPADDETPGKVVGDYAYEVHEHMEPMGPIGLGHKSQEKQSEDPGVVVGGGFMERAAEEIEPGIEIQLQQVLDELF